MPSPDATLALGQLERMPPKVRIQYVTQAWWPSKRLLPPPPHSSPSPNPRSQNRGAGGLSERQRGRRRRHGSSAGLIEFIRINQSKSEEVKPCVKPAGSPVKTPRGVGGRKAGGHVRVRNARTLPPASCGRQRNMYRIPRTAGCIPQAASRMSSATQQHGAAPRHTDETSGTTRCIKINPLIPMRQ
eukprot:361005-Chlamydomonas_euryale.AAC.14